MAIDPSIALGFRPPEAPSQLNMLAQAMQLQGMQRQNQMGALDMQDRQAVAAEQERARNYLASGADIDTPQGQAGLFQAAPRIAPKLIKDRLDIKATQSQIGEREANARSHDAQTRVREVELVNKTAEQFKNFWGQVQTPQQAQQLIAQAYAHPVLGKALPGTAEEAASRIPTDPAQFGQYLQRQILGADEFIKRNTLTLEQSMTKKEQERHNKATEGAAYGTLAVARERLALDKAQPKGILDSDRGLMVDPRTGEGQPVTVGGAPVGAKPDAATKKELMSLNQQESIIDGAIAAVRKTPSAFTFRRGLATMTGPLTESAVGRLDSDEEQAARSYVFNNVSKVINERAGAAQSAQELARLRSFLPAETDDARQIENKMNAFKDYLKDMRAGTTPAHRPGSSGGWSITPVP